MSTVLAALLRQWQPRLMPRVDMTYYQLAIHVDRPAICFQLPRSRGRADRYIMVIQEQEDQLELHNLVTSVTGEFSRYELSDPECVPRLEAELVCLKLLRPQEPTR